MDVWQPFDVAASALVDPVLESRCHFTCLQCMDVAHLSTFWEFLCQIRCNLSSFPIDHLLMFHMPSFRKGISCLRCWPLSATIANVSFVNRRHSLQMNSQKSQIGSNIRDFKARKSSAS